MARPTNAPAVKSRSTKKKVVDSSEEEVSDNESAGQQSGSSSSEEDSDDALAAVKKKHKNVNGSSKNGANKNSKTRVVDDEEDGDSEEDSESDSQNVQVAPGRAGKNKVNNTSTRTAKSLSDSVKSGNSANSTTQAKASLNGAPMQPLQPSASHPQRSPFRTVSLNDGSASGSPRRRLSNSRVSRADDLRRQSLPSNLRKTINADGDESFASDASNAQDVTMRRGSTSAAATNTPTKHALAQAQLRRTSAGRALQAGGGGGGGVGALNAAAAIRRNASGTSTGTNANDFTAQLPQLTMEVMNTNYEEWMKLATDNKINTSNTWSFALIDYFHDMSLLRNADDEGSINFQKASCTLDGCVKIWTSRVDSVATETGKLLNGLSGDAAARAEDEDDDDDNGDGEGEADENGERRPKKKKSKNHTSTLADSFSKIQVKELELEFTVDPLFKKTSADFDEGGAAGLLMNHLGSDSNMRVVFDAGDAKVDGGDEDEDEEEEDDGLDDDEKLPEVDISKLKAAYISDINILDNMTICPSFAAFKFNADPTLLDLSLLNHEPPEASGSGTRNDDGTRETPGFYDDADDTPAVEGAAPVDFFDDAGPAFGDNDGGYADDDGAGGFDPGFHAGGGGDGSDDEMAVGAAEAATGGHYGAVQRFDPRMAPEDREVVIGMGGEDGEKKVFGYFDTTMSKNWAGPEHWKMRRTVRRFEKEKEEEEAIANKTTKSAKGRKAKEPFSIKFTVAEDNNAAPATKTIFASSKATLNLPSTASSKRKKGTLANKKEDYLLPDDKHFASQQLLTLFLKPKAAVNMKRRMQRIAPRPAGEVDEHYWAAAAAAQAGVDATGDDDDDDYGPALPFDTQFFHDDGDTPDFDDDLPMGGDEFEGLIGVMGGVEGEGGAATAGKATNEEDDLLKATQGGPAKRVRPIFVNYARKAKRVDVRLLKENIWKELALESSPSTQNEPDATPPVKEFTSVISGLRTAYPEDKMEEISTSFCFICLLHLANEQGLRIQKGDFVEEAVRATRAERAERPSTSKQQQAADDDEDDTVLQELRSVGGLEKLRIKKVIMT